MTSLLYFAHAGLWLAVVVEGLAICALLYKSSLLSEAAAQGGVGGGHLPVGATGPNFRTTDLRSGEAVSREQLAGARTSVLFVSPTCADCRRLLEGLANAHEELERIQGLVASCTGPDENCVGAFGHRLEHVPILADDNGDLSAQFGIRAWPALVELDTDWRIVGYSYPSNPEHVIRVLPKRSAAALRP